MNHSTNKRNNANTENIHVSDVGFSSYVLSHKTKDSLRIGRRELLTYEHVLSGDNVRISTQHDLQFMPTLASMLPAMDVRIEHTFIPYRSINAEYMDTLSYVEGVPWNETPYPHFKLADLFDLEFFRAAVDLPLADYASYAKGEIRQLLQQAMNDIWGNVANSSYLIDYRSDMSKHLENIISGWSDVDLASRKALLAEAIYKCWFKDLCGTGSYLDKLNCPIIKPFSLDILDQSRPLGEVLVEIINSYDQPIFEMNIRALFADWFETTRDSNLEPARTLPRYARWTNSNISRERLIECLLPRYAVLGRDIFTTANIDSPYRHVVAPIAPDTFSLQTAAGQFDNKLQDAIQVLSTIQEGQKFDLPSATTGSLANYLQHVTRNNLLGIDLNVLRRAKQAKDWLTRGHVYGDEYQDYILAQYGVKVSDARINKPIYLGGYSKEVDINTTTNATSTAQMPAGAKNCTMTSGGGDEQAFNFRAEENGIVLTWAYIAPAVTYEPYDIRNTMQRGIDFPTPAFAQDSEEQSVVGELSRDINTASTWVTPFGRHPYAHAWRSRVDENHGDFLEDLRPYTFLRRFAGDSLPRLNAAFIHVHVNLDFMVDTDPLNRICFGTFSHNTYVQRALPIVTDFC